MEQEIKTSPEQVNSKNQNESMRYVKPLERFIAFLIDFSLVGIFALVLIGIEFLFKKNGIWNELIYGALWLSFLMSTGWYFIGMNASKAKGTLGKQLYSLKITDTQGRRLSTIESGIHFLSSIGLTLLLGVSWVKSFRNKKYRTYHDILSGAVVIQKNEERVPSHKQILGLIFGLFMAIMLTNQVIGKYNEMQMMEWKKNMSLKMALEAIIENNKPVFDYVETNIKEKKGFPKTIHASILPSRKDQTYYIFTYLGNQQRIIINVRVSGKKATMIMEPTIEKDGDVRWYCGSVGFDAGDLPEKCHSYEKKY